MIHTGLVSVTFRKLQPGEIIGLVKQAGLTGIEWGGDVHVPPGHIQRAREVFKMTAEAGLRLAAYGSYYQVSGLSSREAVPFEKILETAIALQAPTLRVWAGNRGSTEMDKTGWQAVVDDSRRIAALAAEVGVTVAFEYHENTLTDTSASAGRLLQEIGHPNMRSYWQPLFDLKVEAYVQELKAITPWLSNLHVYQQKGQALRPLAEGVTEWLKYVEVVKNLPGERFAMIEFVKDGAPGQFLEDAEALKHIWVGS